MSIDHNCKLLPTQQKLIEKIVIENGFLMEDFKWRTTDFYVSDDLGMGGTRYLSSKLTYNITEDDFYFKFNQAIRQFKPEFSPAPGQRFVKISDWIKWDRIGYFVGAWLRLLKNESEAMGILGKAMEFGFKSLDNSSSINGDQNIDENEIKSIEVILDKIETKIVDGLKLEKYQAEFTRKELNEIKKNIKKLGKSGSRKFIIGTFLNIGLYLSDKINIAQLSKLISSEVNQILVILSEGLKSLPL